MLNWFICRCNGVVEGKDSRSSTEVRDFDRDDSRMHGSPPLRSLGLAAAASGALARARIDWLRASFQGGQCTLCLLHCVLQRLGATKFEAMCRELDMSY